MDFVFITTIFGIITSVTVVVTIGIDAVVTDIIITSIVTTVKTTILVLKPCRSGYGLAVFAMNVTFCYPRAWSLRSNA